MNSSHPRKLMLAYSRHQHTLLENSRGMSKGMQKLWLLLQVQRRLQHFVRHRDGHCIRNCPRQTSGRLGKRDQVRKSVSDPSPSEDPEMQQGCGQLRTTKSIQQSNAKKRDNIFKVIEVASGERSKIGLQWHILLSKALQDPIFLSIFKAHYC